MMLEIRYDCENYPSEAGWVDDYMCERVCVGRTSGDTKMWNCALCVIRFQDNKNLKLTAALKQQVERWECVCVCVCVGVGSVLC